jgi:hypothetical protein
MNNLKTAFTMCQFLLCTFMLKSLWILWEMKARKFLLIAAAILAKYLPQLPVFSVGGSGLAPNCPSALSH